jgi:hypothetical protein
MLSTRNQHADVGIVERFAITVKIFFLLVGSGKLKGDPEWQLA